MISIPRIMSVVSIAAMLCLAAHGQEEIKRLAILRTVDDGEPSVEPTELIYLTGRLREIAGNVLQNNYGIMTEQSIIDKLGRDNAVRACKESEGCLAQLGRKINADYIGQARLGRFGGNLTIIVELYNSGNGLQASPAITGHAKDVSGLLAVLNEKAPGMFGKMPGIIYVPEPTPTPVPEDTVPKIATNIPAETKKSSEGGLGWRGITRIAVFSAAGILGAAATYKHFESRDRLKELDFLKTPGSDIDEWKRQYNAKADEIREKEKQRNIFGALAGVCVLSGVVTFFF